MFTSLACLAVCLSFYSFSTTACYLACLSVQSLVSLCPTLCLFLCPWLMCVQRTKRTSRISSYPEQERLGEYHLIPKNNGFGDLKKKATKTKQTNWKVSENIVNSIYRGRVMCATSSALELLGLQGNTGMKDSCIPQNLVQFFKSLGKETFPNFK